MCYSERLKEVADKAKDDLDQIESRLSRYLLRYNIREESPRAGLPNTPYPRQNPTQKLTSF